MSSHRHPVVNTNKMPSRTLTKSARGRPIFFGSYFGKIASKRSRCLTVKFINTIYCQQQTFATFKRRSCSTAINVPNIVTTSPNSQEETKSQSKVSWEKVGTNGTFTKTYNLSGSVGVNQNGNNGKMTANIGLDCNVSIHATPYNWRCINKATAAQPDGELLFDYKFDSTSGSLADLASCFVHERVTYPGGNPYNAPSPFSFTETNPLIKPFVDIVNMVSGGSHDAQKVIDYASPFSYATFTANQRFEYNDAFTGEFDILVPSDNGDNTAQITRTIAIRGGTHSGWWYSVSKHGVTAWRQLTQSP